MPITVWEEKKGKKRIILEDGMSYISKQTKTLLFYLIPTNLNIL